MAAQDASQQLRWRYGDVDDSNFAVRDRGIPLLVALLAVLVCFVGVCFYLRWACRRYNLEASASSSSSTEAPASSSANGLDAATIAGLHVTLYRRPAAPASPASPGSHDEDDAAQCCSICLGEFAEGEKVKLLPRCGHCFHPECVDAWLRSRTSCPLCRGSLLDLAAATKAQVGSEAV